MSFRFVTRQVHAWLDYPVAASLIATPFLLKLGASSPLALGLSVATGVAAFKAGRQAISIEREAKYIAMIEKRQKAVEARLAERGDEERP